MSLTDFGTLLDQWGPIYGLLIAVLAFFIWKDWRLINRLQDRVELLEKEQKEVLLPMVEKCVAVVAKDIVVMERVEEVLNNCIFSNKHAIQAALDQLRHDDNTT